MQSPNSSQPPKRPKKVALIIAGVLWAGIGGIALLVWSENAKEAEAKEAARVAEERRKGFHCLSKWDGSSPKFVDAVSAQLRDPKSFEHIETRITPVKDGRHTVIMQFRARNGFGGMNAGTAIGSVSNADCSAEATLVE